MCCARVAGAERDLAEGKLTVIKQLLDALYALCGGVSLYGAPLAPAEYTAYGVVWLTDLLFDARREIEAAFVLVAHMVHYRMAHTLRQYLLRIGDEFESVGMKSLVQLSGLCG